MCVLFYFAISRIMIEITRAAVSRLRSNNISDAHLRVTIAFDCWLSRGCSLCSVCNTPIIPDCRCASIRSEALHPSSSHTTSWRLTSSPNPTLRWSLRSPSNRASYREVTAFEWAPSPLHTRPPPPPSPPPPTPSPWSSGCCGSGVNTRLAVSSLLRALRSPFQAGDEPPRSCCFIQKRVVFHYESSETLHKTLWWLNCW